MSPKIIFLFIIGLISFQVSAQYADSIFTEADQMPYFPGCSAFKVGTDDKRKCSDQSAKALVFNHIIYPKKAKEAGIEGAVFVRFVVNELGQVTNPQILKDIGGGCGEEALRMLKTMPKWEPAIHRGQKVKVALELSIHFYLKDNKLDLGDGYTLRWGTLNTYEISKKDLRKNLQEMPSVFNSEGKHVTISELRFSYKKKKKITSKSSNGSINPKMVNFVKKLKKGGFFSVVAVVQKEGNFIEVEKEFVVIK